MCVCVCDGLRLSRKGNTALVGFLVEVAHSGHPHAVDGDDDEEDGDDEDMACIGEDESASVTGVA